MQAAANAAQISMPLVVTIELQNTTDGVNATKAPSSARRPSHRTRWADPSSRTAQAKAQKVRASRKAIAEVAAGRVAWPISA